MRKLFFPLLILISFTFATDAFEEEALEMQESVEALYENIDEELEEMEQLTRPLEDKIKTLKRSR